MSPKIEDRRQHSRGCFRLYRDEETGASPPTETIIHRLLISHFQIKVLFELAFEDQILKHF